MTLLGSSLPNINICCTYAIVSDGVLFHTDCVQAAGCHKIDVREMKCDFASISSHKIHGCKGVGALFVRDKSVLSPIIYGGAEQEYGLRGGTENVAGIVGFGVAAEIAAKQQAGTLSTVGSLDPPKHRKCILCFGGRI